jgi:hypothetical protein
MKPVSNIVYEIQHLTISFILELQENICTYVPRTHFAGRRVVGFRHFFINVFLEVQDKKYSSILYLIDYVAHGIYGMKFKCSRKCAGNLFANILA